MQRSSVSRNLLDEDPQGRVLTKPIHRLDKNPDANIGYAAPLCHFQESASRRDRGPRWRGGEVGDIEEGQEVPIDACRYRKLVRDRRAAVKTGSNRTSRMVRHDSGHCLVSGQPQCPRGGEWVGAFGPEAVSHIMKPGAGKESTPQIARLIRQPGKACDLLSDPARVVVAPG